MKPIPIALVLLLLGPTAWAQNYPGGIVYGPKAAVNIAAPEGWVLDNQSGVEQGLPCVLYPKGSTWADATTVMYAKIASPQFEKVDDFVAMAIKEMQKVHGMPKQKVESGKTGDSHPYSINEYPATKSYSQWSASLTFNFPKPWLTSFSRPKTNRATANIRQH